MCILCILRAEAEQNQAQSQSLEQAAQEAAASIATKLFGEDVVKAAMSNEADTELSKEEAEAAERLANELADAIFGKTEPQEDEEPDILPSDLAEALADQLFGALFGEEALAEVKAHPQVQAAIAERRAADKAEQDNVIKFPRAGSTMPTTAQDFLKRAQNHMEDRAVTYDSPEGERSMEKTVQIFNALRERDLTETEGWLFMSILKMVRANQGEFKSDNYEDLVAYAALMGESEVKAQA
ncbi:DUF6378 domain-containing protein [Acinetobacter baumannii]|uniref:DUF6378 domain-containing protein n=1 Tax=Acinetobacter baumannii TaxID=470 RepID=UPI0033905417